MGCFSWLTADTKESISVCDSGLPNAGRAVYLLQPGGMPPIEEVAYEGYGRFGDADAYVWLAQHNLAKDLWSGMDEGNIASLGIALECGSVLIDPKTGGIWSIFSDHRAIVGGSYFRGRWDEEMPGYGATPNDLVKSGRLVDTPVADLCEVKFPLKFSFNRYARYEDLPASKDCPWQGFG